MCLVLVGPCCEVSDQRLSNLGLLWVAKAFHKMGMVISLWSIPINNDIYRYIYSICILCQYIYVQHSTTYCWIWWPTIDPIPIFCGTNVSQFGYPNGSKMCLPLLGFSSFWSQTCSLLTTSRNRRNMRSTKDLKIKASSRDNWWFWIWTTLLLNPSSISGRGSFRGVGS